MRVLSANLILAIIIILFFNSQILNSFSLHPKIIYAISFLLYFLVILFNLLRKFQINNWLFFAVIVVLASALLGLYLGWNYIDISADIARYLAPFMGYSAGLILLKQMDYDKILFSFYVLFGINIFLYYLSVISKINNVFQGGQLVEYASPYGLEVHAIYAFLAYFLLKNKIVYGARKILMIGYIIGFIANPILIMSKARLLALLLSFGLIFLFFSKFKDRFLMVVLALFIAGTSYIFFEGQSSQKEPFVISIEENKGPNIEVFSRIEDTIELFQTKRYDADASTAFRVAEIKNIAGMIYADLPQSLLFGFGSGALYYDDYSEIMGGIHKENFRSDGGVHDIFFMPLGYLFRYGIIGFFFIICFSVYTFRRLLSDSVNLHQDAIVKSLKLFIIISFFADLFVGVHVYGNFTFGLLLAFGIALKSKLIDSRKSFTSY